MTDTISLGNLCISSEMMDADSITRNYIKKSVISNCLSDFSPEKIGNLKDIEQICAALSSLWNAVQ